MSLNEGARALVGKIWSACRDRAGVTSAEYAILAVGIIIVVGGSVFVLDNPLNSAIRFAGSFLNASQESLAASVP